MTSRDRAFRFLSQEFGESVSGSFVASAFHKVAKHFGARLAVCSSDLRLPAVSSGFRRFAAKLRSKIWNCHFELLKFGAVLGVA